MPDFIRMIKNYYKLSSIKKTVIENFPPLKDAYKNLDKYFQYVEEKKMNVL